MTACDFETFRASVGVETSQNYYVQFIHDGVFAISLRCRAFESAGNRLRATIRAAQEKERALLVFKGDRAIYNALRIKVAKLSREYKLDPVSDWVKIANILAQANQ